MQGMCSQDRGDVRGVGVPEGPQAGKVQAIPGRVFHSVDAVLRWAYELEEYSCAKAASYAPMISAETGERMTTLERRAQAACIQQRVERLGGEARELVVALYSWNHSAQQSIDELCRRSVRVIDLRPAPLIEALVVRHCRQVRRVGSESLKTLSIVHGTSFKAARYREDKVRGWLGQLWYDTEGRLYREWAGTGLIQS